MCIRDRNNVPVRQANFDLAKQSLTKSLASSRTTKFAILSSYMAAKKMGLDYSLSEKIYNELPKICLLYTSTPKWLMEECRNAIINKGGV